LNGNPRAALSSRRGMLVSAKEFCNIGSCPFRKSRRLFLGHDLVESAHVPGSFGGKELTVLLTGFSAFPGAPSNPTEALVAALRPRTAYFAKFGIRLELRVLPVLYATIAPLIAKHVDALSPDVVLHFGLAGTRRCISIETLAHNRLSQAHPDADGQFAECAKIRHGGAGSAKARLPTGEIAAALRRAGCACQLSRDAGDYLCNAAFYLSLANPHVRHAGFIHVPPLHAAHRAISEPTNRQSLTMPRLRRAAEIIVLTAAKAARRNRKIPPC
jgi:pyroglutamyl-peptidase